MMTHKYIDGWHEIWHNYPSMDAATGISSGKEWAPCKEWCTVAFGKDDWYMREVQYISGPGTVSGSREIIDIIPLTWMFKKESDAMLFLLRWA